MKALKQIDDVTQYVDSDGIAIKDLLNKNGAVLVRSGMPVHDAIYRMPVYRMQSVYNNELSVNNEKSSLEELNAVGEKSSLRPGMIEFIEDSSVDLEQADFQYLPIEKETVLHYYAIKKDLQEVFESGNFSIFTYRHAVNIIEVTYNESRDELLKALWLLRSQDRYTCDHSLSVYLLFLEAIDDFKKHQLESAFYDSLKNLGGKVNFDPASLKRYAMGALLHDFGKMSIEERIVHKNTALTLGELDLIRLHPYYGVRALKLIGIDDHEILDIVGNHHHNYRVDDVSQSPLSQICNIVDIYDACRAGRSYKDGFSWERTLAILKNELQRSGWDPFIYQVITGETLVRMEKRLSALRVG